MRIYLHEITDEIQEHHFTGQDPWVLGTITGLDESYPGKLPTPKARTIVAEFSLHQVDEVVVINGKIQAPIELCCSRCATPFLWQCNTRFMSLYCKDPVMAGMAHFARDDHGDMKAVGRNKGLAKSAPSNTEGGDEASSEMDINYVAEDYIELSDVLREQVQLEVPFQPLCDEACKGICSNCGADLNKGRCACAKIKKETPFAVLEKLKLR